MVNLCMKLTSIALSNIQSATKDFVQVLIEELKRRFPNWNNKSFSYHGKFSSSFFQGHIGEEVCLFERALGQDGKSASKPARILKKNSNKEASLDLTASDFDLNETEK